MNPLISSHRRKMLSNFGYFRSLYVKSLRRYSTKINKSEYQSVVGLEVHAQLLTRTKLFSASPNDSTLPANTAVSLFDAAYPGTLPRLNVKAVELAVRAALALNCTVNETSMFDRKHYFYADSPAGYQITQQHKPIAICGELPFFVFTTKYSYTKSSKIRQIQLEQDSGKSLHFPETRTSLIDLNRAGIPLIEIVFEPDLSTGEEAASLLHDLRKILEIIGVCSGNMSQGAMRCDANISIHKKGEPLGIRTEVKNVATIRGVAKAIDYEINRQIQLVQNGKSVINETRSWDPESGTTVAMRDKEVVQDYRFMPEPCLPPLKTDVSNLIEIRKSFPELPNETRAYLGKFNLQPHVIQMITKHPSLLNLFKSIGNEHKNEDFMKKIGFLLVDRVIGVCNKLNIDVDDCQLTAENVLQIQSKLTEKSINMHMLEIILTEVTKNPHATVQKVIEEKGLIQITDPEEIKQICLKVIEKYPKIAQRVRNSKEKDIPKLMRLVRIESQDLIHSGIATDIMKNLLKKK